MTTQLNTTPPIYAFASGKGGVGKTSSCLNTAAILAKQGKRVLVFDGDFGLANVDVQLGMTPQKDLSDVIAGYATLADIMVKSEKGFWILPGRSGASNLPFISTLQQKGLLDQLKDLAGSFDIIFIDVPAGLDETVLGLCKFADKTLLVTTPDPSSITDAYAIVKLLHQRYDVANCELLINQAGSVHEGKQTATKLTTAAKNFLGLDLKQIGQIPYDRNYANAVKMQQIVSITFPNAKATEALEELARNLLSS